MPFDDTMNSGAVPQADQEAIARRLMGDSLVDRYGDVIGARPTGVKDVLRDFTIGFTKGQDTVDALHMKMQNTYRDEYNKAAERALVAKKADIEKSGQAWEAVKWAAEKAPRGYATKMLKERLTQLGFDPESLSPTAMKMLSDADFVAQLPREALDGAVQNGAVNSTMLGAYFSDPLQLDKFRNDAARRARDLADTDRIVEGNEQRARKARADKEKLKDWRKGRPLSIANAQLRNENLKLQNQKLREGAGGGVVGAILSGKFDGLGLPSPVEPAAVEQPVAGVEAPPSPLRPQPTAEDIAGIKAKYGLK